MKLEKIITICSQVERFGCYNILGRTGNCFKMLSQSYDDVYRFND